MPTKNNYFWSINGRTNLQETTAPLLTKMEVKEEHRSDEGQLQTIYRLSSLCPVSYPVYWFVVETF